MDKRKWLVIFRNAQRQIVGPVWEVESKVRPTRWANATVYEGCTHDIEEVSDFNEDGYIDREATRAQE